MARTGADDGQRPSLLQRTDRAIVAGNMAVVAAMLAVMVTLVFVNVVMRYVFGQSFDWIEEVTRYMMIWLVYLAVGLALRNGNHVAVTMIVEHLPDGLRRLARILVALIIIGFMIALAWLGWRYALFAWNRSTPILSLSLGMMYLAIPAGAVLVILHALLDWRAQTSLEPPPGLTGDGDSPVRDAA